VERTIYFLSKEFTKRFQIDVLTFNYSHHFLNRLLDLGVNLVDLKVSRTILAIYSLRKYIESQKPHCMISMQYYANVVAIMARMISDQRVKVIVSERLALTPALLSGGFKTIVKNAATLILMKIIYRYADAIVFNSHDSEENFQKIMGNSPKSFVISNPVIDDEIVEKSSEEIEHRWFKYKGEPIVIGVGRLTRQKGFETLIKAFKIVNSEIPSKLVILGEGREKEELEDLVREFDLKERVWMPGFVENPYKYIARSDVFVLSSKYEGLPNALIEALALGIPCISTDCPSGPKEILLDGECGLLVPVGDHQSMADAILKYLKDSKFARSLLSKAKKSLDRFSVEKVTEQFLSLIE
jgi:glycosyltransferase involved in cell wall biosynthesis